MMPLSPAARVARLVALPLLIMQAATAAADARASVPAPPRPSGCVIVSAGAPIQPALDAAPEGAALCLEPGEYSGPVRIERRRTLWGPPAAVVRSVGSGTTVELLGESPALLGVTVDGSGGRFDLLDAAVRVQADGARVEGVSIRNALFGLLSERSKRVLLKGNRVYGAPAKPLGLRGDGIRLWETHDSRIEHNTISDSRDVVVWYSSNNVIGSNRVENGRYGTHFMYSHRNRVVDNRYLRNVVGIFVMYSRELEVRHNLLAGSTGASGMGIGVKESGELRIVSNHFLRNGVGLYMDTSPLYEDDWNDVQYNRIQFSDAAVVFHSSQKRNRFHSNSFRDNVSQVRVEGRGDALAVSWRRNAFDDYVGYDLDGDGYGDVPYELRSLSQQLTSHYPMLAFLRGSLSMGLVELIGRVVPVFETRALLVDPEPAMGDPSSSMARAD